MHQCKGYGIHGQTAWTYIRGSQTVCFDMNSYRQCLVIINQVHVHVNRWCGTEFCSQHCNLFYLSHSHSCSLRLLVEELSISPNVTAWESLTWLSDALLSVKQSLSQTKKKWSNLHCFIFNLIYIFVYLYFHIQYNNCTFIIVRLFHILLRHSICCITTWVFSWNVVEMIWSFSSDRAPVQPEQPSLAPPPDDVTT